MLIPAGFAAAWILTRQEVDTSLKISPPPEMPQHAPKLAMPEEDVSGEEVNGLPRYPGSARVEYEEETRDGLLATRAKYLADAGLDEVREFYRQTFRSGGWSVADLDFSTEEINFFVIDGDREARLDIRSRGEGLTEIEIAAIQPPPDETPDRKPDADDAEPSQKPDPEPPSQKPPESTPDEGPPPDFTPSAPPVQAPPAQGPPPQTPPPQTPPPQTPPTFAPPAQGPPSSAPPPQGPPGSAPGGGPPSSAPGQGPPSSTPPSQGPPPGQGPPESAPGQGPPSSSPGQGPPGSTPGQGPPASSPGQGPPEAAPGSGRP
ncbi:MAG: hypothetical protein ACRDSJ_20705 [Rubrobacteraceae bacterium]